MSTEDNKLDPYKMSFKPGFKLTAAEANAVRKFLGGLNEGLFVKCTDCGQFAQFDGSVVSVQRGIQWVRCGACVKRSESSGGAGSVTVPLGTFEGSTRERIDAIAAKGVTTRMKP